MTNQDRRLLALIGMFVIFVMALAAVGPVFAQTGGSGSGTSGSGQGSQVAVEDNDTLGTLVTRYATSTSDLRQFFTLNGDLKFDAGQTVTFPADATVNIPLDRQGANGSQGQGTGTTSGSDNSGAGATGTDTLATPTASAGGATGTDTLATPTVSAGGTTGTDTLATPTAEAGTGTTGSGTTSGAANGSTLLTANAQPGQTYVTQEGDTLGMLLGWMGFTSSTSGTGTGSTSSSGATSGSTTSGGTTSGSTTGTDALATPTASADTTSGGTGAQATPTAEAGTASSGTAGAEVTDQQLQSFLVLNQDLTLANGQMVYSAGAIPQTGTDNTGSGTSMETKPTPQTGAGNTVTDNSGAAQATPTAEAGGATSGGTTSGGTTSGTDNSGAVQATPTVEAGGTTGGTTSGGTTSGGTTSGQGNTTTYTVQAGDTLESIAQQFGITVAELVTLNPNLLTPGQTINVPNSQGSIPQTGGQGQSGTGSTSGSGTGSTSGSSNGTSGGTTSGGTTSGSTTGGTTSGSTTSGSTTGSTTSNQSGGVPQTGQSGSQNGSAFVSCQAAPDAPKGWGVYRLQGGESLASVANRFGASQSDMIVRGPFVLIKGVEGAGLWNNQNLDCGNTQQGSGSSAGSNTSSSSAGVPVTGASASQGGSAFVGCQAAPDAPKGWGVYRLQNGESAASVARRFGVSQSDVMVRGPFVMIKGVEGAGMWNNQALGCSNTQNTGTTTSQ